MAKWIYEKREIEWDVGSLETTVTEIGVGYLSKVSAKDGSFAPLDEYSPQPANPGDVVARTSHESTWLKGTDIVALHTVDTGTPMLMDTLVVNKISQMFTPSEWMEKRKSGDLIETLIAEEGTYPDDGPQGDYWYVKIKKVFPDVRYKNSAGELVSIVGMSYKDSTGKLIEVTGISYKDSKGTVIPII